MGAPRKKESMMVVTIKGVTHDVRYYNDDTGYGETACGKVVGPWDTTICGKFSCKKCHRKES
mgnify:CR=1 FL=1